jgi:hypothetical protein
MAREHVSKSQMLAGTEPYGTVAGMGISNIMPAGGMMPGTELAPPSGRPYFVQYQTCTAITKIGEICQGPVSQGTPLCIGHLRALANQVTPLAEGEPFDPTKLVERAFGKATEETAQKE